MLKADRVELALLNLLIDWRSHEGRSFSLPQLEGLLADAVGPVSQAEAVEALVILQEDNRIAIDRFVGNTFMTYSPAEGIPYFYSGQFRCIALPRARRRQQELSQNNKSGVFISHISEEKLVALRLQRLLEDTLTPAVPVFVSSDYHSIESGERWYGAILSGLRRAQVIISMLSPASVQRPWINFEAGYGMGQDSRVIPLVWRGLYKDDIGLPLNHLQARDLSDPDDLKALLDTIGNICDGTVNATAIPQFLAEVAVLEPTVLAFGLQVTPFLSASGVSLGVRNTGNRPPDLIDAELLVPSQILGDTSLHAYPPVRDRAFFSDHGDSWKGFRLTTEASTMPYLGIEPLRPIITPEMGEVIITGLSLPIQNPELHPGLSVRYRVSARQASIGPKMIPLGQLTRRN